MSLWGCRTYDKIQQQFSSRQKCPFCLSPSFSFWEKDRALLSFSVDDSRASFEEDTHTPTHCTHTHTQTHTHSGFWLISLILCFHYVLIWNIHTNTHTHSHTKRKPSKQGGRTQIKQQFFHFIHFGFSASIIGIKAAILVSKVFKVWIFHIVSTLHLSDISF